MKGLELIFDSGSSYTYFNSQAHKALVNLVRYGIQGALLLYCMANDNYLPSSVSNVWSVIQIANDLRGKPLSRATGDPSLPICWKGPKPFKSLHDVTSNFKPLLLSFTKSKNSPLQLPPEAYLIVTVSTFLRLWIYELHLSLSLVKGTKEIMCLLSNMLPFFRNMAMSAWEF